MSRPASREFPDGILPALRGLFALRLGLPGLALLGLIAVTPIRAGAQEQGFVTRSGSRLMLATHPFYFLGANAYYLPSRAAYGDTETVVRTLAEAAGLGMRVIRTWAFFDSPDSLNRAVIQYRPGVFSEEALRGLDYVIAAAARQGVRLLLPLVNSWDDFGGMNQYVRWRVGQAASRPGVLGGPGEEAAQTVPIQRVRGPGERSYVARHADGSHHDDFYTDPVIRRWFGEYMRAIVLRVNTLTGIRYADDPAILGWELANEPRSSDPTGETVTGWVREFAALLKSLDPHHLVGTGEEGFDTTPAGYPLTGGTWHAWMFDGSAGISFAANSAIETLDFATAHLYSAQWDLPPGDGNLWIRSHLAVASALGKPLLLGEFASPPPAAAVYDSWLSTALSDGAAGALVWQLADGLHDPAGYGISCPGDEELCRVLRASASAFALKSQTGALVAPAAAALAQSYPNPCNTQATIAYALPFDATVRLVLYNVLGEIVRVVVDGLQRAGVRKELLDARSLPAGAYYYRLEARAWPTPADGGVRETGSLLIVR